jgi:hypothetical protein
MSRQKSCPSGHAKLGLEGLLASGTQGFSNNLAGAASAGGSDSLVLGAAPAIPMGSRACDSFVPHWLLLKKWQVVQMKKLVVFKYKS